MLIYRLRSESFFVCNDIISLNFNLTHKHTHIVTHSNVRRKGTHLSTFLLVILS
jgi:hypothetical protein